MPMIDKTEEDAGKGYQILGAGRQQKRNFSIKMHSLRKFVSNGLLILLVVIVIMGAIFFKMRQPSPEVKCLSKYKKTNIETAVKLGRLYAYSLLEGYPYSLDGNQCELLGLSISQARNKMAHKIENNLDFFVFFENEKKAIYNKSRILENEHSWSRDISILMNIDLPRNFSDPIFSQLSDMKLIKINREGNVTSMDFVYSKDDITPVLIPEKGNMVFRVTAEYVDDKYWAISDYAYSYSINDYLQWRLNELKR